MDDLLSIRIRDVNDNIVCSLCAGYYIEATTITECLHTFCKSCVVQFLQSNKNCPQCNLKIHETQPMLSLKADRVMQDIVYKLVPHLYDSEEKRKQEFYKSRGIVKDEREDDDDRSLPTVFKDPLGHLYSHDELICLCIERHWDESSMPQILKKFVRCSIRVRITHIKQLISKVLKLNNIQLQVLCCNTPVHDSVNLKQLYISHWFGQTTPMVLQYRRHGSSLEAS